MLDEKEESRRRKKKKKEERRRTTLGQCKRQLARIVVEILGTKVQYICTHLSLLA